MKLMMALCLLAMVQEPEPMPDGWKNGSRSGWDGECPPEWDKKTPEEREAYWKDFKFVKYQFIKHCQRLKDKITGPVTAADYMLRGVHAGLTPKITLDLAKHGMDRQLKEVDFKIMMKAATAVYGTEVPQVDVAILVKEFVNAGDRGAVLDQKIKMEIQKRAKAIKELKKKEDEKKKKEEEEKKKKSE